MLTSRLPEDQPTRCDCFRVPHAFYCATITRDLVPGYPATADGLADAADQRRADECPACGAPVNAGRHTRAIDALNCDF
jgi:hypothetical protein